MVLRKLGVTVPEVRDAIHITNKIRREFLNADISPIAGRIALKLTMKADDLYSQRKLNDKQEELINQVVRLLEARSITATGEI